MFFSWRLLAEDIFRFRLKSRPLMRPGTLHCTPILHGNGRGKGARRVSNYRNVMQRVGWLSSTAGVTIRALTMSYKTEDIRNVCLVGPSNAGKTQLAEALLFAGGSIKQCGSVDSGDTVSDFTAREQQLGHSQYSAVCHLDHGGIHVNLIDTPGYRDFYGRAVSVLPAVETAAVVISADGGVEMIAQRMMKAAKRQRLCRMIIINKIDAEGADLAKLLAEIRDAFGPECLPLNLPSADGSGVVDCFF